MQTLERRVGSWGALLVAAGLCISCSGRTEIRQAEPKGETGGNGGNETGSAQGGSDNGQAGLPTSAGIGGTMGSGGAAGGTGGSASGAGGTGGSTGTAGSAGSSGSAGAGGTGGSTGTAGGGGAGGDVGKIVLFDGSRESFDNWYPRSGGMNSPNPWKYNEDGTMTMEAAGDDILSKTPFTDVFVHVEYVNIEYTYPSGTFPELRGRSGVMLNGSYELEVVDTFGFAPANNTCGSVYAMFAPLVSACKMAGDWNAYDIEFRAPVCTNGVKTKNATFVEVKLNGILVQQNVEVPHVTQAGMTETCEPRGVLLREHATVTPVTFRNIWAIPRN